MRKPIAAMIATLALSASPAFADSAAYSGAMDLWKASPALLVAHHHDWGSPAHPSTLQVRDRSDSGHELLKQDLTTVDWARYNASVTNWIRWYKTPEPRIVLTTATHTLEIEDASGVMRMFQF